MAKSKSLPTLPFDLIIQEILSRLSVTFLFQLRCVCKSWNSLISADTIFAEKHLDMSTTRGLHFLRSPKSLSKYIVKSFPLDFVFSTVIPNARRLEFPVNCYPPSYCVVGSCNGIICVACSKDNPFVLMWNPSIRKFKELPRFQPSQLFSHLKMRYGFGYDHVTHNYKVVVVIRYKVFNYLPDKDGLFNKTEVKVHTFGTDFWKDIDEFPFGGVPIDKLSGKFVSGTINWLVKHRYTENPYFIVSFDLGNESYQKILVPDYGEVDIHKLSLSVLKDFLCMIFNHDVWVMKEYGHTESWTKLFTVSYTEDPNMSYILSKAIYMFDDDQVLLELKVDGDSQKKLIVYDIRSTTFKFTKYQNESLYIPEVCVESLISP